MKQLMLCALAIAGLAYGQTPGIEWQKFYGGTKDDDVISIRQTTDGGYIYLLEILILIMVI